MKGSKLKIGQCNFIFLFTLYSLDRSNYSQFYTTFKLLYDDNDMITYVCHVRNYKPIHQAGKGFWHDVRLPQN